MENKITYLVNDQISLEMDYKPGHASIGKVFAEALLMCSGLPDMGPLVAHYLLHWDKKCR